MTGLYTFIASSNHTYAIKPVKEKIDRVDAIATSMIAMSSTALFHDFGSLVRRVTSLLLIAGRSTSALGYRIGKASPLQQIPTGENAEPYREMKHSSSFTTLL